MKTAADPADGRVGADAVPTRVGRERVRAGNPGAMDPVNIQAGQTVAETAGVATGVVAGGIAATMAAPTTALAEAGTKAVRHRAADDDPLSAAFGTV